MIFFLKSSLTILVLGGLLGLALLVIFMLLDLIYRWRKKQQARLDDPWLKGVPLPKTDDPRWRGDDYDTAWLLELGLTVRRNGNVDLDKSSMGISTHRIGSWRAYARAVLRHVEARKEARDADLIVKRLDGLYQDFLDTRCP